MFPFVARILMIADVKPRPAIEPAGAHTADVVGRQIVADLVPLISAHPKLGAAGTKCDSYCIANSPRINFSIGPVRSELKDARAIGFRSAIGNVRARTDGDIHLCPVRRKDDVASPMSATAEARRAARKTRGQLFG